MQDPSAYTVTYTATDAASNVATATRVVNVEADTTAPVITVVGANPASVATGATYTDAGATAVDNIDGAVSVVTTGVSAISVAADANWSDVTLLLPLDTDFTDASTSTHTVTAHGNTTVSTSDKKFGAGSVYFDGSGDHLTVAANEDFNFGSGDFTVELWVKTTSQTSGYIPFFSVGTGAATAGINIRHEFPSDLIRINSAAGPGSYWDFALSNASYDGDWHHLSVVRDGDNLSVYFDGSLIGSPANVSGHSFGSSTKAVRIGNSIYAGSTYYLDGHFDDIRITKGVARHTSNFTVPTAAHPTAATGGAITGTHTVTYTATDASSNQATGNQNSCRRSSRHNKPSNHPHRKRNS